MATERSQNDIEIVRFDWAMKSLLRIKANFAILEGFLLSLLGEKLTIEEILESESNADSEDAKYNCVDLLAKDSQGRRILIEIQNERESDYLERMLFGASKLVVESIDKGQPYGDIPKIISIHILYFNLGHGTDYVYAGTTELRGVHTQEPLEVFERVTTAQGQTRYRSRDVFPNYYVINVDRFNRMDAEDLAMLDQWIYLFKRSEIRGDFDAPGMESARQKLAFLKMNKQERQQYERFVKNYVRELDILKTAHDEGLEEGLEKGREEGLEKGLKKGLKKGRDEGLEEGRREIAVTMQENGFSVSEIAKATGISQAEIERLLDSQIS